MLKIFFTWALDESLAFKIKVLSAVNISNAFGIFLPCLDTLTLLIDPTSRACVILPPFVSPSLYARRAPDKVKYLFFHFLKILHLPPFFSFNWPSMTGSSSAMKVDALSGWLQRKHPHCNLGALYSNTSKNLWALSSWITESWSLALGKAPVTKVEKDFSSHLRISQQFFRLETPESLVDRALCDLDWRARNIRWIHDLGWRDFIV